MLTKPIGAPLTAEAHIVKAALTDGAATYGANLEQRYVPVEFSLVARGNGGLPAKTVLDEYSNVLARAFSPKTSGWAVYYNSAGSYILRVRPNTAPTVKNRTEYHYDMEVELIADNPLWQRSELFDISIGIVMPKFSFPLTFPFYTGQYISEVYITNPQNEHIKPVFYISRVVGDLTLKNESTGAEMKINKELTENQNLIVNTAQFTVSLYENGEYKEDISNLMDGDFITLPRGNNLIKIYNDLADNFTTCRILYRLPVWEV
jgi:hypothetical protein